MLSLAEYGGPPKFCHVNTPLQPMALPQWASLHKLPMAVVEKSAMPFHHSGHGTAI